MKISEQLALEFNRPLPVMEEILALFDGGNTVPFVARYRKEVTQDMDDVTLRDLVERRDKLEALEDRAQTIEASLRDQGKWTEDLAQAVAQAQSLSELEDIYRPYKPKRRTRATMAREKGLGPIGEAFIKEGVSMEEIEEAIKEAISQDMDQAQVRQGVMDIVAEIFQDHAEVRQVLKKFMRRNAVYELTQGPEPSQNYAMYLDREAPYEERYSRIPNHRVLAIDRGEKEKALRVSLRADKDLMVTILLQVFKLDRDKLDFAREVARDAMDRLIYPSIERELRRERTEEAQREAIDVFGKNLKPLLLQPPLKKKRVLAIDPGLRTGCKLAVIDEYGQYLDQGVIYPTPPRKEIDKSRRISMGLVDKYHVDVVAIGSGTASQETEKFVSDMIDEEGLDLQYAIINEDGASVYSASSLAQEEFPDLDVTIRGAISIGRRLQDPLAELVKIEPRHIGVGQYQHDLDTKALDAKLDGVVEDCVNHVGVDVNRASRSLLSRVAGISKRTAQNLIAHRTQEGPFKNRKDLLGVKGLGPKTYEQAAGFLRIPDGEEPLDKTGVHPESYGIARILLDQDLEEGEKARQLEALGVGAYTLEDIKRELAQPGRDPREDLEATLLRDKALTEDDLKEGLVLKGVVRNVVDFGAFVDIGVKKNGLIHISKMTKNRRLTPYDLVEVGDILEVEIIKLEKDRDRISLAWRKDK
ncbi:MAG: Tex-like N-terminal domain-containing protein [Tissierellia bacterium]|nr:Tex-like N-terminal domain-containing protein [Tissierellia bacterium]